MQFFKRLLLLISLPATSALAQSGYTIKMELTGFKDGTQFELVNLDQEKLIDSTKLEGGKLIFKGKVKEPITGRIHTIDGKYVVVYLENKTIDIKGSYSDLYYAKIEGSEINTSWTKSRDAQKHLQQLRDSLVHQYMSLTKPDSVLTRQIVSKLNQVDSVTAAYRMAFIKNEKPSHFTMHELFFLRNDYSPDSLKSAFGRFPENLQKTKNGSVISAYINNKVPEIGGYFMDVEGRDPAGKKHKLSDFKGSYVLLEFWASWCGPCRQENQLTVQTYAKYQDKGFRIFGYSTDADSANWVKAIKHDNLTWLNVSDLKGSYSAGAATYQVRAIPQNFLIDPRGIIIAKDLRGKHLADKLKAIYKE